ncbi:MAG: 5' nucleotidase, NT5C type [Alphaproteobacteria bacterium]
MIFCDMDGVLVDFEEGFFDVHGKYPSELSHSEMWQIVLDNENHWLDLPPMKDAQELINFLAQYEYQILTGLPIQGFDKADKEKKLWIEKHISKELPVICCLSRDKHIYCQKGDILIDDRKGMISDWEEAGGIGILHETSEKTISELKKLLK